MRDDTQTGGGLTAVDLTPQTRSGRPRSWPDAIRGSEVAPGVVGGDELENYHVHLGTSVNVNDPAERDGDWHRVTANAACNAGEQMVGVLRRVDHEVETRSPLRRSSRTFGTNSVTAQGITDDGGTDDLRTAAVCVAF